MVEFNGKKYDSRHGGPFDRGSADSWYSRAYNPHYYLGDIRMHTHRIVEVQDMTSKEIDEYAAGYNYNEQYGGKKEY